jgi:glycerol-3-phosphate dehydrogenase subunit B
MRDTIVIGAGLAGLMGALTLAEAGRAPLLLAKGLGATHWTSGTIDIWGKHAAASPRAEIAELIAKQPSHPFAKIGLEGISNALERFRALMADAHYPYVGSIERNLLLPTALGALRPAALVPTTMIGGDMSHAKDDGRITLIAGFRELGDFFPPLVAANLSAQGIPARGVYLHLPPIKRKLSFDSRVFAQLFDDAAFREEIGRQLRLMKGEATRIGLPAVLGLKDPVGVVRELQHLSGAQVFEIPTLPPSVPGIRLYRIFRRAIQQAGGRLQIGAEVLRGESEGKQLRAVFTAAAAREQEHRANAFLLATGGVAGGGIRTDHTGAVWETALDLPLRAPDSRGGWFHGRYFAEGGHPIFQVAVATDAQLRPLDANDQPIYHNVAVAGSTIANFDPIRARCYSGLAITSGWYAGTLLAQQ